MPWSSFLHMLLPVVCFTIFVNYTMTHLRRTGLIADGEAVSLEQSSALSVPTPNTTSGALIRDALCSYFDSL